MELEHTLFELVCTFKIEVRGGAQSISEFLTFVPYFFLSFFFLPKKGHLSLFTRMRLRYINRGRSSAHSAERSPHQDNTCINRENTFLS